MKDPIVSRRVHIFLTNFLAKEMSAMKTGLGYDTGFYGEPLRGVLKDLAGQTYCGILEGRLRWVQGRCESPARGSHVQRMVPVHEALRVMLRRATI